MNKLVLPLLLTISIQAAWAEPIKQQDIFSTSPNGQNTSAKPKTVLDTQEIKRLFNAALDGNITAANTIKSAANDGNHNASLLYGYMAHTGKIPGKSTDYALAMKAYKKATRQKNKQGQEIGFYGNHLAAYNIGIMYLNGHGIAKNIKEAYRWFNISQLAYQEKQGGSGYFYPAIVHMARMLETGSGVARNDKEALKMWKFASNENVPEAMVGYAKLVMAGRGTAQNIGVAMNKLNQAAEKWNLEAMTLLAKLHEKGDNLNRKPNPKAKAKWLMILASADRRYRSKANTALNTLKPTDQNEVRKEVASFLSVRSNIPEAFDYNKPLYQSPKRIY
ncbi:MAG: sel1 repeat family protein [Neisseriaceae bacterium]|nr:sel1 repeat family protein [Neisseriaceae bacterium]MBR0129189.1 sel1 repeat family protein [Neisseriaceae bacterium]